MLAAIAVVVALPVLLNYFGVSLETKWAVALVQWPTMLVVVALVLELLYRCGPSRLWRSWRWISWGSAFAAVAWIVASLLFSWYAANFGSFNKTYGSLGAVIGFMMWIWISIIVILIGAELDAVLEAPPRAAEKSDAR